ncbi:MAG: hypothetical protein AB1921_13690 [Thermodesulfobacteriota bacterium]
MMAHFRAHSEEHEQSYRMWAENAEKAGKGDVAKLLRQAAEETARATETFKKAEKLL